MEVVGVDERQLGSERNAASFLVFIYEGLNAPSWSVDSYLLTGADLPSALDWLREHLPRRSCWALGLVVDPPAPTDGSELSVHWIVGADVMNASPERLPVREQRLREEMLARRHHVPRL